MKNKKIKVLLGVVLFLLILCIARNAITRVCLQEGVKLCTGLRLSIGTVNIGLWQHTIDLKNLTLFNPPGYKDPVMAAVGEIHLRYRLGDMLRGQLSLNELRITLRELFILRRSESEFNFNALNVFESHGNNAAMPLTIDDFNLNIGRVIYKDYTHPARPVVKTYDLDLDERYKGIHGANDLERLITIGILNKTSIASLISVNLNKLREVSDHTVQGLIDSL